MRTVHEMPLHLLRILELLHEARMFPYSRNVEGLHLRANGENEIVIGYRCVGDRALDLRGICAFGKIPVSNGDEQCPDLQK